MQTPTQLYPGKRWCWLVAGLTGFLAMPVVASWLQALWAREPCSDNALQALTLALLGIAIVKSAQSRPMPHWQPSRTGLALMLPCAALLFAGGLLSIKTLYWGAFLGLLSGMFLAMFGERCWRAWIPVFLFSLFLLPKMPNDLEIRISLPLQWISTQLTAGLAGLLIPIQASGNLFFIRGEAFEVTPACSGLHTWTGFLFAGFLWMLFERFSPRILLVALLAAPLLAVGLNAVRLSITALVAYYQSPDAGEAIHTNLEYVLFPLGMGLMWALLSRLREKPP